MFITLQLWSYLLSSPSNPQITEKLKVEVENREKLSVTPAPVGGGIEESVDDSNTEIAGTCMDGTV